MAVISNDLICAYNSLKRCSLNFQICNSFIFSFRLISDLQYSWNTIFIYYTLLFSGFFHLFATFLFTDIILSIIFFELCYFQLLAEPCIIHSRRSYLWISVAGRSLDDNSSLRSHICYASTWLSHR